MAVSTLWHFYIRQGTACVPVVARTDAGFFLDIDPVAVIPADDREALMRALADRIAGANPGVETAKRSEYDTPVVVRAAGVKTWATFAKSARCFTVCRTESGYLIPPMEPAAKGWVENLQRAEHLPLSSSHEDVARALVAHAFV